MDNQSAMAAFAALAQDHRLKVFKRLMDVAPSGLSAGDIARELGIPASTLSTHLAQLQNARLLRSWRRQRHVFYTIDMEGTGRLVSYLINDCCRGHPEICGFDKVSDRQGTDPEKPASCKPRPSAAKSGRTKSRVRTSGVTENAS